MYQKDQTPKQNKVVDELMRVYCSQEWWHNSKMSPHDAIAYHMKALELNLILYIMPEDRLYGYVEFWRINYEQFGKIICGHTLGIFDQNFTDGNICYLANTWIDPEYRNKEVYKLLKKFFFKANAHCDYFVGQAKRKKTEPVKVFTRQEFYDKYAKEKTNG